MKTLIKLTFSNVATSLAADWYGAGRMVTVQLGSIQIGAAELIDGGPLSRSYWLCTLNPEVFELADVIPNPPARMYGERAMAIYFEACACELL